jgi:3-isopropylmalate dehydratase small subunit
MTPFRVLQGRAAPMPDSDIDTDIIFPARFLLLTDKGGLDHCAFRDRRFDAEGRERPDFVLHRAPWRGANILVAGANFGGGSSREQAVWALADLGIRCIVAPSFGEIFEANAFANGLLPIRLGGADHGRALNAAEAGRAFTVDLPGRLIDPGDGAAPIAFDVGQRQREALLAGLDEIGLIQRNESVAIAAFERLHHSRMPWLAAEAPLPQT